MRVNNHSMSDTALLIIDMFNDYRHDDAEELAGNVAEIIGPLRSLRDAAQARADVDVVYVNDNHENFTAGAADIVDAALSGHHPELITPLLPVGGYPFLTKVRHSVFYATALDYLLRRLDVTTLILTGQVTEQCILYSALDGYIRHFDVIVPPDTVAHIDPRLGEAALTMMRRNMDATIVESTRCLPGQRPSTAAEFDADGGGYAVAHD